MSRKSTRPQSLGIPNALNIRNLPLKQLKPAPYNPRVELKPGNPVFEQLKHSINTFGIVEPIIWNRQTGFVVGGHQRLSVLESLGQPPRGKKPPRANEPMRSTLWSIDTIPNGPERPNHPTPKPLDVFEIPMRQHTKASDICYEPFAGSGTQLIAAEKLGRRCFALEISPHYCDVIVRRWIHLVGAARAGRALVHRYATSATSRPSAARKAVSA